ncbi:tumor necrosis factor receptor superfamily member 14-like isoform X8 [Anguilla anguilla]|uniref:tumor necrosis factor receptor superfamily member 14-like isoform X8 n=1 Tax=Anguilla anguilla TaxID=7936 RepID=UPI0015AE4D84|nr:tumor necrosis factor receptor superfamily member 14-like isoform X8 [Anguilla anguilla]XP_035237168.1 tumor necrosis factor receptor superfamily member 14-like isoform X8 [Anguilla anguilla]XP_035237169.1 tumor necrosis factor receptor superfamily member 14-like isoform X8 [Anguilla anguilla]
MDIYQAHSKAYLLLLFCGLAYSCGSAEYEINGKCCPMCTPGTHVYKHCTEFANTSCVPCTQKSFIAVPTGLSHCLSCTVCEPDLGLKTERECTPTSDTVCGPLDHHYCTKTDNKGCSFAQKHTICRPGQFIIHSGTTLTNTECGDCPDKTFSDESFSAYCKPHTDCLSFGLQEMTAGTNTSDSECGPRNIPVYIIIVPVMLALAVILAIIFILRKFHPLSERKKKPTDPAEGVRMTSTDQPQDEGSRRQNMKTDLTEREGMNRTNQPQDEGSRRQNVATDLTEREGMNSTNQPQDEGKGAHDFMGK